LTLTLWDRWEMKINPCTLGKLFEELIAIYKIYPKDCFKGKKAIFSYVSMLNDEKDKIMQQDLKALLGIDDEDEYCDLNIAFTVDEKSEEYLKNTPVVRVLFTTTANN